VYAAAQAQIKPFLNLDAGYVNDRHVYYGMYAGIEKKNVNAGLGFFVEAGGKFQITQKKVPDVAGIDAGISYNKKRFFSSVKAGGAVGFNRLVKDVYKPNDSTEIVYTNGAPTSTFLSPVIGISIGYIISDAPFYIDVTYAGKLTWFGAGVKIIFE